MAGTRLTVIYSSPGWILIGNASIAWVEADGRFNGRVQVSEKIPSGDVKVVVRFDPRDTPDDDRVIVLYGAKGEKMTGAFVVENGGGGQEILIEREIAYTAP